MNATEAKEMAIKNISKVATVYINLVNNSIKSAAEKGNFYTIVSIEKKPNIYSLTNSIVEHFGSYGYEVSIHDGEAVQVRLSWENA